MSTGTTKTLHESPGFSHGQSHNRRSFGAFSHFLQTSLNSETRRTTSPSIQALYRLFSLLPNSSWLTNIRGFHDALVKLARDFRNRAAHLESLSDSDYRACREFVLGREGLLWRIIFATQRHKK